MLARSVTRGATRGRRGRLVAAALLVPALALIAGCADGSRGGSARPGLPNVLLVTLDTTRVDALGAYGARPSPTPELDAFAEEAVVFETAVAEAPVTLPSHASILTALEPSVHGARDNGRFALDASFVTLAERMQELGYDTAAEVAAVVLASRHRLDQGFDRYGEPRIAGRGRAAGGHGRAHGERPASEVVDASLAWLESERDAPFFLWVHLFDPHQPYTPPIRHARAHGGATYRAEVAFADEQVGRLLHALEETGAEENTLVVITADHGESLGEHGESTHGFLAYDTTLRVPLLVRAPGTTRAGLRVPGVVRNIDIAPTLLDLVDAPPLEDVQGVSLRAMLTGEHPDLGLQAHSEVMLPAYAFGYAPLHALRYERWKYIHGADPELYDVVEDPGELKNLANERPEVRDEMESRLRTHLRDAPLREGLADASLTVDAGQAAQLRGLGYVGQRAGSGDAAFVGSLVEELDSPRPSPHERRRVFQLVADAEGALTLGRSGQVLDLVEQIHEIDPALGYADLLAARAHEERRDYAAALMTLERLLDGNPDDVEARTVTARVLWSAGRLEDALAECGRILELSPDSVEAWAIKARAHDKLGELEAAREAFREAVALDPRTPWMRWRFASALYRSGRIDASIRESEAVLQLAPAHRRARTLLAAALAREERCETALDEALRLDEPDSQSATAALVRLRCALIAGNERAASDAGQRILREWPSLEKRVRALREGAGARVDLYVDPRGPGRGEAADDREG